MEIPSLKALIRSRLLLAGLLFFGMNCTYSHIFYNVDSFKIALALAGVSVIAVWNDLLFPENTARGVPWKQLLIVSVLLLGTLPGYFWQHGNYNYNFRYDLTSYLVVMVWALYLYRGAQREEDLKPFFFIIGITVAYVGCWAILERLGYDPLRWGGVPVARVNSTFGNTNYFAEFLVVLLPLLLACCLPEKISGKWSLMKLRALPRQVNYFYVAVLVLAVVSLVLTETRAAQGAALVSLGVFTLLYVSIFTKPEIQRKVLLVTVSVSLFVFLTIILLFCFAGHLPQNRYTQLFTIGGWAPRFAAWIPALKSIEASPLVGFGLGSSSNLFFAFADPNRRLYFPTGHIDTHAHSEFLEYTQEGGLVGLIILLIFWGYLFYLLRKVIRSEETDPTLKKIAIGVIAGFVGYLIHSAFSVAPRMMVVRLPLFTLIGLTLALDRLSVADHGFKTPLGGTGRLISIFPAVVALGSAWLIFTPWLVSQYRFMELWRERPTLPVVTQLENLVQEYPNINALKYLTRLQVKYQRVDELQKTISMIDKVLPNYQGMGYVKAIWAEMRGDLPMAQKYGLEFQNEQDRYFEDQIYMLMRLSLVTNNFILFKHQFELLVRKMVFDNHIYYGINASDVEIKFDEKKLPFIINSNNNMVVIDWNDKIVRDIFDAGRAVRSSGGFSENDRGALLSFLQAQFSSQPYFQLNIKNEYLQKDKRIINNKVREYFTDRQQLQKLIWEFSVKDKRELAATPPDDRPAMERAQREERISAIQPIREQMAACDEYLTARSDWPKYLHKQEFAISFVRNIDKVVYPLTLARNN